MITAVDTSVLIDVFGADVRFGGESGSRLREALGRGALVACDVVWAECAAVFPDEKGLAGAMKTLGVGFVPISQEAALLAGRAWKSYRRTGGTRTRLIADFLIGAHAETHADALLTRDRGFYRSYFAALRLA